MKNITTEQVSHLPYKNVAVALLFTAFLGPVGLLYSTFWGGLIMIIIGIVVISNKFLFPIILLWLVCCIWGVAATESYNRKINRSINYA